MTDKELHDIILEDAFNHLKDAQHALDTGDAEELAACLAEAGFTLCTALPGSYAERAPDAWFEGGVA
ncbi:hypothetical protein Acife_1049 [Acidithiobacillus ferrivorans SS3]|uniref:Uncharacterized protein n=1 Tax=Acidithiobacillus ferrivorans SS3 TaxID=743299 RepID=G0JNI7_9PROT|nr:hypothetical protein [Acidithiobacillus ferrivorans]AEM47217.1 hypothetical protein Acife_1049 [Acidithiobacillus ferrivorans SS3]OFA17521.1 hypothetical protein A4U49_01645 [Acidithiobacillus ferrivorans]